MSLAVGSLTKEKITLYHCALRAMRGLTSADDQSERSSRVLFLHLHAIKEIPLRRVIEIFPSLRPRAYARRLAGS